MKNSSDVLIIGGGVIGFACAYYLLKEGRSVRIIERDTIGEGASGGNCGFIFSSHILPLCSPGTVKKEFQRLLSGTSRLIVKPTLDMSRFVWLLNFARKCNPEHLSHAIGSREEILRHSKLLYQSFFSKETFECDQSQNGILIVFKTWKEFETYRKTVQWLEPYHLSPEHIDQEALLKREPSLSNNVVGGWYYKNEFHLHPKKLVQEWEKIVLGKGADVEENCTLKSFDTDHGGITGLKTSRGVFTAKDYVLCAGAWTGRISARLKLKVPVQPAKGYSLTFKNPSMLPKIPCIFYERRAAATPWEEKSRLGGFMEFVGFNSTVCHQRIRQIKECANEYLAEPLTNSFIDEWAGFRPMCYDDLPVIGRPARYTNLVLATGHGTTGLSMAPGTGKLVAEIIRGKKPFMDITAFSPDRF